MMRRNIPARSSLRPWIMPRDIVCPAVAIWSMAASCPACRYKACSGYHLRRIVEDDHGRLSPSAPTVEHLLTASVTF